MTKVVTTDYTLPAGQSITSADEHALLIQGADWTTVTLAGQLVATSPSTNYPVGGIIASTPTLGARILTLTSTASVSVSTDARNAVFGIEVSGPGAGPWTQVVNQGAVKVHGGGGAEGVAPSTGGLVNSGSITVDGSISAVGVRMAEGGSFLNSGTIMATAGGAGSLAGAIGVMLYQVDTLQVSPPYDFVNTGTIKAALLGSNTGGICLQIAGFSTIHNSGLIEGDYAIKLVRDGLLDNPHRMSDITNSGTLRGDVFLNDGAANEPQILHNSGMIAGAVTLNTGADIYDGASGSVTGVVHGDDGADSLGGGVGAETLSGDAGADTIDGGGGADVLDGGDGVDVLSFASRTAGLTLDIGAKTVSVGGLVFDNFEQYVAGRGDDIVQGSAAGDTMAGGAGADTMGGGLGDDRIDGGAGDNYLHGDDGNDVIQGGQGFDKVNGNKGDDVIDGGPGGNDWLLGGQGNDRVIAHTGDAVINGNIGADTVSGGDGADVVRGGQDDDILSGGAGNDHLFGDRGNDTLTGGAGADTFHFGPGGGEDRVLDFNAVQGDRVQVDGGLSYAVSQSGPDTIVTLTDGERLILVGVQQSVLPEGWILAA